MKKATVEFIIENENFDFESYIRDIISYYNVEISSYKEIKYDPRWHAANKEVPMIEDNELRSQNVYIRYGDNPATVGFFSWSNQWYDLNCKPIDKPDYWRHMTEEDKDA